MVERDVDGCRPDRDQCGVRLDELGLGLGDLGESWIVTVMGGKGCARGRRGRGATGVEAWRVLESRLVSRRNNAASRQVGRSKLADEARDGARRDQRDARWMRGE